MTTARILASAFAALAILAAASLPASAVTLHRNADFAVAESVAVKAGDSVAVTAKTANLRSGPSSKSKKIAALSPNAVKLTKEMVNAAYETPLSQGVKLERRLFHSLFAFEDQKEGMAAFIEKRQAEFKGR